MQYKILNLAEASDFEESGVKTSLSFKPFLDYIRARLADKDTIKKDIYELILHKFSAFPELEGRIELEEMAKYKGLLDLMFIVLSSVVEDEKQILWGLCVPVSPHIFYGSDPFYQLMQDAEEEHQKAALCETTGQDFQKEKMEMLYSFLLERFYHFKMNKPMGLIRSITCPDTGQTWHYKVKIDTRFVDVTIDGELPLLQVEDMKDNFADNHGLELIQQMLPLSMFSFSGISVITIQEVTEEHALDRIRNLVVDNPTGKHEKSFGEVIAALKTLAGTPKVEFGLLPLFRVNNKLVQDIEAYCHSIIFSLGKQQGIMNNFFLPMIEQFIEKPRVVYFRDLEAKGPSQVQLAKLLHLAGIRSYALVPIYYNQKLIGAFEAYAREKEVLDEYLFSRLDPAMALIAQLMQNSVIDFDNEIDRVIKNKFTSLQPAVQWRFNEAAWHYLYNLRQQQKPQIDKIKFEKVYPLYGAIDMRNSTQERNNAVRQDLRHQLELLDNVLIALKKYSAFGLTDEFIFKCNKWKNNLQDYLTTNEELRLNQFLNEDAFPFLLHFREKHPEMAPVITDYIAATDMNTGSAWKNRRHLEESMQLINNSINNYLELMNTELQQAYPCYFEKFRTDGVEYDIYIGQAIAPDKPFDVMYLKNLRLWQLRSMAAIARLSNGLLPQMAVPLQTTQLIFIYSNTIDISFRNDEHRFDVEGGYNIRYHVIKKRIDKVRIKNTGERLTQPLKIALVYFNQRDADEYISYIQYLQEENLLNNDLEYLELEELQGVTGLKALRVGVNIG